MLNKFRNRTTSYIVWLIILFCIFIFGISVGFIKIEILDVFKALIGMGTKKNYFLVYTIRMPKLLITIIMGAALALSGSVLQTLTRNDLADPGILGINSGAGLGVTLIYLYADINSKNIIFALPTIGMISALATFGITYVISLEKDKNLNVDKLVLVGVGSAISLSGAMILFISSADRGDVQFIYRWLSGNIWGDTWSFVFVCVILVAIISLLILLKVRTLDILSFDDITSTSLGTNLKKERRYLIILSVALAAIVVSVAGSISFVGLIIPHISKKLYGPRHKNFLIGSLIIGAIFLMSADIIGRSIFLPEGLPTGIVVALIGSPYFLYLVVKKNTR